MPVPERLRFPGPGRIQDRPRASPESVKPNRQSGSLHGRAVPSPLGPPGQAGPPIAEPRPDLKSGRGGDRAADPAQRDRATKDLKGPEARGMDPPDRVQVAAPDAQPAEAENARHPVKSPVPSARRMAPRHRMARLCRAAIDPRRCHIENEGKEKRTGTAAK